MGSIAGTSKLGAGVGVQGIGVGGGATASPRESPRLKDLDEDVEEE